MLRVLAILATLHAAPLIAQVRPIPATELRSGLHFAGTDMKAMQADDAANPGMLWVARGEQLWNANAGAANRSCATCHGDARASMRGIAARYPAWDDLAGAVMNLETRIEACRMRHQQAAAQVPESDDLLALAAWVGWQSHGLPIVVTVDGPARAAFERGRAFHLERHGQMNLACAQCHDQLWGKRLLNEPISQGHPNAFPAYRLEWQGVGSLQRRIRACLFGVRAQSPPPGSPELIDLELYLAWRAQGLPLEAPGVRR